MQVTAVDPVHGLPINLDILSGEKPKRKKWESESARKQADRKTRYDRRIAEGICTRCGKEPPRPGKTTCQTCQSERSKRYVPSQLAYNKKKRRERMRKGMCTRCGKNPSGVKSNGKMAMMCDSCREYTRIKNAERKLTAKTVSK